MTTMGATMQPICAVILTYLLIVFSGTLTGQEIHPEKEMPFVHVDVLSEKDLDERITSFIFKGWDLPIRDKDLEGILDALGEPNSVDTSFHDNHYYPDTKDILYKIHYDDLMIGLYWVPGDLRGLILAVEISSNKYAVKRGLGVGASEELIKNYLGVAGQFKVLEDTADEHDDMEYTFTYYCQSQGCVSEHYVEFLMQHRKIKKVTWIYYID
ncbi:hypothetical protein ACFL45_02345 [Candidatus Neomarinimicrobiota bacterium]